MFLLTKGIKWTVLVLFLTDIVMLYSISLYQQFNISSYKIKLQYREIQLGIYIIQMNTDLETTSLGSQISRRIEVNELAILEVIQFWQRFITLP